MRPEVIANGRAYGEFGRIALRHHEMFPVLRIVECFEDRLDRQMIAAVLGLDALKRAPDIPAIHCPRPRGRFIIGLGNGFFAVPA